MYFKHWAVLLHDPGPAFGGIRMRQVIAFDTETHLIKHHYGLDDKRKPKKTCAHMLAPKLVCLSYCIDGGTQGLLDAKEGVKWFANQLQDRNTVLVGHNTQFDVGVLCAEEPELIPAVFSAYEDGRLIDTKIRQALIDIARGELATFRHRCDGSPVKAGLSLADLVYWWYQRKLEKEDTYRLRYAELDKIPLVDWPEEAKQYARDDAFATWKVWHAQEVFINGRPPGFPHAELPNQVPQYCAALALHFMSLWGIRTDAGATQALKETLVAERDAAIEALRPSGIFKFDKRGKPSRDMSVIYQKVEEAFNSQGLDVPRTKTGRPETSAETLLTTGDPDLMILAKMLKGYKVLTTYVPVLESGNKYPICANYNVLVETGRTSCGNPNIQNPPRKMGVRECFVARPGHVFVTADFDTAELRSLAQVQLEWFGHSKLAEAFRDDKDPHLLLAGQLIGRDYAAMVRDYAAGDKAADDARQFAKIGNFGYPGGLGAHTFVDYAAGYGFPTTFEKATMLREAWFETWEEMEAYFSRINDLCGGFEGTITQLYSDRVRGRVTFTEAANTFFQGLTADGAKQALWDLCKACYLAKPGDVLYGVRPVAFLHDEIITEVPYDSSERAHLAALKQAEIMRDAMAKWVRDVPIKCGPVMMRKWMKGAKSVMDKGLLVPGRPEIINGKTIWSMDHG